MAGSSVVEGMLVDWVRPRPPPEPRLPVSWLSAEEKAEELQRLQRNRARDAAREAELILGLAADRPDELDPPPGTPGAKRGSWKPDGELPGVSDSFPAELSMVLNCGRGTAVWRARRAWVCSALLPQTFAALQRGELDERRAQELFDALQAADPELVPLVDAAITRETPSLLTLPHAGGGPTACTNLCCLCRSHHWVKTFAKGWRFVMDPDGTLHVTTPTGVTRTTRPPGLRPPPPEPSAPAEPATPPPTDPDDLPPF